MHFADLLCGAGGLSAGLIEAGMAPAYACDAWQAARDVYRRNLGPHVFKADLSEPRTVIRRLTELRPDLIAGGPPCQEFSPAGKRVEGKRAELMLTFTEVVVARRPDWFLMENVPGARNSPIFRRARRRFGQAGYGLTQAILNAGLCGVPQRRYRLILVGRLGASDGFLDDALTAGLADKPMAMGEALPDLVQPLYFHGRVYQRRAVHAIDEPAPTIRGVRRDPPPGYKRHPRDAADPKESRAPTIEELSIIQGFPRDWIWRGKRTAIAPTRVVKLIGNAVPPPLARHVGRAILDYQRALTAPAAAT